jgi:Fe-S cluster assembly protein SufD
LRFSTTVSPSFRLEMRVTAAFCRETLSVLGDGGVRDMLAARLDAALVRMETA